MQDYKRAAAWMQSAAEGGHPPAQFALGLMYRFGTGVPTDNVTAYTWLNIAAAGGVSEATVARDAVLSRLSPQDVARRPGGGEALERSHPTSANLCHP